MWWKIPALEWGSRLCWMCSWRRGRWGWNRGLWACRSTAGQGGTKRRSRFLICMMRWLSKRCHQGQAWGRIPRLPENANWMCGRWQREPCKPVCEKLGWRWTVGGGRLDLVENDHCEDNHKVSSRGCFLPIPIDILQLSCVTKITKAFAHFDSHKPKVFIWFH